MKSTSQTFSWQPVTGQVKQQAGLHLPQRPSKVMIERVQAVECIRTRSGNDYERVILAKCRVLDPAEVDHLIKEGFKRVPIARGHASKKVQAVHARHRKS